MKKIFKNSKLKSRKIKYAETWVSRIIDSYKGLNSYIEEFLDLFNKGELYVYDNKET